MKNNTLKFRTLLITALLFTTSVFYAQVNISLNILPPYSPYLRDYMGYMSNNKTLITLLYTNGANSTPIDIYLTGSIRKDDNSISVEVRDGYRPGLPITLIPNIPKTLTGTQLQNIFGNGNINDLILKGINLNDIIINQALPEGIYNVCIRAKQFNNGAFLNEDCRSMFIAYSEPPQITYPINNTTEYAKFPQYLNISWTPVTPFIQGLTYRLRLVKVPFGVSMYDAINNSLQVVLEKSNIQTTNFPLDLASGIKLDTGAVYAVQVTGLSRNTFIKNDGKSEPIQFMYKSLPGFNNGIVVPDAGDAKFVFLNPREIKSGQQLIPDTIKVNNENNLLINWCWTKEVKKDTSANVDKIVIAAKDIQKYKLTLEKIKKLKGDKSVFTFNREFQKSEGTGLISDRLQLTDSQALANGFENNATYKATLKALNSQNKEVASVESPQFVFKKIVNEIPSLKIPVQAVINYSFKNFPEIYPVSNSEVTIDAFKIQSSKSAANVQNAVSGYLFNNMPSEIINGISYVKIASTVVQTDSLGKVAATFTIPEKYFDTDSMAYRVTLANPYYVDKDFGILNKPVSYKDSIVNFGNLVAKTYAYKLKLNVKKEFTQYNLVRNEDGLTVSLAEDAIYNQGGGNQVNDDMQSYTYDVTRDTIAEGIPVLLYRKNKPGHLPVYEGVINKTNPPKKTNCTVSIIGYGTTVRVKDSTSVTFEKLLSSVSENDPQEAYYIIAIKNLNEFLSKNTNKNETEIVNFGGNNFGLGNLSPALNDLISNALENQKISGTNFVDSGKFVAEEKAFWYPMPVSSENESDYYRSVTLNYNVISCTPPTSKLKGRLFYTWKSDANKVKRPLANTHFRVVVDYVDGKGKSIGAVSNTNQMFAKIAGHWEYTAFQPSGSDDVIPLVDQYATMAEGTTDGDGNFTIEVVNINKKGNLGSGDVIHSEGSNKPPVEGTDPGSDIKDIIDSKINPGDSDWGFDQNNFGNNSFGGIQNGLNGAFNVGFNAGSQSFDVKGSKLKGGVQSGGMMDMLHAPVEDNLHGPQPSAPVASPPPGEQTQESFSQFRRSFRIVIDGDNADYFYPSKEVIDNIQPFQSMKTPVNITHYVKEFRLDANTYEVLKEGKSPLSEMQVTVFRSLNQKPKNLPTGEGDGKYVYKELISPVYSQPANPAKYEHLWSAQKVASKSGKYGVSLPGLLQSEYQRYKVQSSSVVNTGSKTFGSIIYDVPDINDSTIDWTDPEIPVVNLDLNLSPLYSRALIRVKDSVSGQTLTTDRNTKVYISKFPFLINNYYTVKPVDKYGYAELIANQSPLKYYVKDSINSTALWFGAVAQGYKKSDKFYKASLKTRGEQTTPVLSIIPSAKIQGKVVNAEVNNQNIGNIPANILNGVPAYLQADSGKVFETDQFGNFEMEVAPKAGVKIKIIPKDVAWFDTAYVLSAADTLKQVIDLNNINVYRRKHRLQFNVTTKAHVQNNIQTIRVKNATIRLGENTVTTDQFGKAQFVFENVSVNNYTLFVKGPKDQGYIPKTINLKSVESKNFQQIDIELEKGSEITGVVKMDGKPVKNARVYLEVQNKSESMVDFNYSELQYNQGNNGNNPQLQGGGLGVQTPGGNYQVNPNIALANNASGIITDDANLVVAYTDAAGNYKLQGVPVNNQKINVIATLDTTFTVSGDKQQANILNRSAVTNLNLKKFSNAVINKLYGFPLTVEKVSQINERQVKVTGLVHWTEAVSDFKLKDEIKLLRVEDVVYDILENSTAVIHDNSVKIPGITSLKMSYIDKYNVKLTSAASHGNYNTTALYIVRENDYGKISGKMQIVDNSFNYPSSYLNFTGSEFYFSHIINDSIVNNIISVTTSAFTETESNDNKFNRPDDFNKGINDRVQKYIQQSKPVYQLCDKNAKPITFKLINFDAKANPLKSFIDESGKIHLNALLNCSIPHAQPEKFSVEIPDLILDQNKVYPASSSKPISISLEEWTLEARNWSFSTSEGGILSTDATIKTQIVDIPVGKFVLRNDMFLMEKFKMNQLGLAGGKFMLAGVDTTKAHLNYEYKVGSDMNPHWNFCLLGSGNSKVASLPALTGLPNYSIDLNYIEILSNNEMIVQLMQKNNKPKLLNNPVAIFEPLSIFNGPNYISVKGLLNTGAPRMGDIGLTAVWTSANVNPTFENVSTDFEGKGFVHFEAYKKKIEITSNLLTIHGRVLERPDDTFNPIPATFYAHKTPVLGLKYHVDLKKDWITQLSEAEPENIDEPKVSSKGYKLKITSGGMSVVNDDWTTLKYEGYLLNNSNGKDDIAGTKTKFEVLGDISANSDSLAVTGISTPLGSMSQVFDFKRKELIGTLSVTTPITLGIATLNSGVIETCFGEQGFYLAGGCSAYIAAGLLAGNYNIGLMAGHYKLTDHLWNVTNSYIDPKVQNKCYKQNTETLSGFYFALNREIIDVSLDYDFIIASGYVKALALLGGDFYFNIDNGKWKAGGDGYVYIGVNAGLSAITGTSISGGITGEGKIMFQIGDPSYFDAKLKLGFEAKLEQSLVFTTISTSVSMNCAAEAGTSGFSFYFGSADNELSCPPKE